ncbi:MAG TPA: polysaccharide pyruvyl transferase family protein [Salinivirgaceae bacterium]|nr:polysaccharide pyruvyl transferase family protein [Salinivirgaceae bacterium]
MKIGILTQPLGTNYGGILQNYALQTVLKRMGHEVWTVNRDIKRPAYIKYGSLIKRCIMRLLGKDIKVRVWMNKRESKMVSANIQQFIIDYIHTTKKIYSTNNLKKTNKKYLFDAYVVGSDQVWRPKYSPNIYNFFLDFIKKEKVKRIAFSASFGVDQWDFDKVQTKKCSDLAKKFDAVSVRENTGIKLCSDYLGVSAVHTLDPTMLLDRNDYIKLIKARELTDSNEDMLVYFLDKNKEKEKFVQHFSKENELKYFEIMPKTKTEINFKKTKKIDLNKLVHPPVERWLGAFQNAKFVITDSFHGAVFSIIFNKPFFVFSNARRGNARMVSLLNTFELNERLITEKTDFTTSNLKSEIDWDSVNKKLIIEKEKSLNFLKEFLS